MSRKKSKHEVGEQVKHWKKQILYTLKFQISVFFCLSRILMYMIFFKYIFSVLLVYPPRALPSSYPYYQINFFYFIFTSFICYLVLCAPSFVLIFLGSICIPFRRYFFFFFFNLDKWIFYVGQLCILKTWFRRYVAKWRLDN